MARNPESHCRRCGKMAILGDGLCAKCWDRRTDKSRFYDKYKNDENAASLEGAGRYYVMHNGKFVETTRQKLVRAISGITYHGGRKEK